MNQLIEWLPLVVFFAAFKLLDIFWATAALMCACVLQLLIYRARNGKFKTMHIITTASAVVLGTATLVLHDQRFIQWKPTVLWGLIALAFLGSMAIGKQPLARRMLESVFEQPVQVPPRTWLAVNAAWAVWFALLAVANLYVARHFTAGVWVNFHTFGIAAATMIFMLPQVLWLGSKVKPAAQSLP